MRFRNFRVVISQELTSENAYTSWILHMAAWALLVTWFEILNHASLRSACMTGVHTRDLNRSSRIRHSSVVSEEPKACRDTFQNDPWHPPELDSYKRCHLHPCGVETIMRIVQSWSVHAAVCPALLELDLASAWCSESAEQRPQMVKSKIASITAVNDATNSFCTWIPPVRVAEEVRVHTNK